MWLSTVLFYLLGPAFQLAMSPQLKELVAQRQGFIGHSARKLSFWRQSPKRSTLHTPDPDPGDIKNPLDLLNGSASCNFEGYWSCIQGNSGIFQFNVTNNVSGMIISILRDSTYGEEIENSPVPHNDSILNIPRSIYGGVQVYGGNYSNDPSAVLRGSGVFFPNISRGYIRLVIPSWSSNIENTSIFENINKTILKPEEPWPPTDPMYTDFDPDAQDNVDNRKIRPDSCTFMYYFTYNTTIQPIANFGYPPDYLLTNPPEGVHINSTHEIVPIINGRIISKNCAVDMVSVSPIYSSSTLLMNILIFSAVSLVLLVSHLILGTRMLTINITTTRLCRISLYCIIMMTVIDSVQAITAVRNATMVTPMQSCLLLVAVLRFLIDFVVDFQLMVARYRDYQMRRNRNFNERSMIKIYCIFYVLLICSFIVNAYLPYNIAFYFQLILSSYWVPQIIHLIKNKGAKYGLDYQFVILSTILRTIPTWYYFCYSENYPKYKTVAWYSYILFLWVGGQFVALVGLMIANKSMYQHYLSSGKAVNIYHYDRQVLPVNVLDEHSDVSTVSSLCAMLGVTIRQAQRHGSPHNQPQAVENVKAFFEAARERGYTLLISFHPRVEAKASMDTIHASRDPMTSSTLNDHDNSDEYVTVAAAEARGRNPRAGRRLENSNDGQDNSDAPLLSDSAEIMVESYCMNPLHAHSQLYVPGLRVEQLDELIPSCFLGRLPEDSSSLMKSHDAHAVKTRCFCLTTKQIMSKGLVTCSICLDIVPLNTFNLSIYNTVDNMKAIVREETYLQKHLNDYNCFVSDGTQDTTMWITPCGHIFHNTCLSKWTDDNLQCPVDRQPIPAPL